MDGNTPTLVTLIARRGVIVVAEAAGTRGPGLEPVELDSVFNVMSVTKPITATLVMILAEEGLLGITTRRPNTSPSSPRETTSECSYTTS